MVATRGVWGSYSAWKMIVAIILMCVVMEDLQ